MPIKNNADYDLDLIKGLEFQLLDPAIRRSPEALMGLLADDFIELGQSGVVYGRAEVVRCLAAELNDESSKLETCGHELRELSVGVFLLTYRSIRTRTGAADLHTLRSSVWKLINGSWRMVFHQGTPTQPLQNR